MATPSATPPVLILLFFELIGIVLIGLGAWIIVTRRVPWLLQDGLLGLFKSRTSPPQPIRTGGFHALIGGTIVLRVSAEFPSVPHPAAVALTAAAFVPFVASMACLMFLRR